MDRPIQHWPPIVPILVRWSAWGPVRIKNPTFRSCRIRAPSIPGGCRNQCRFWLKCNASISKQWTGKCGGVSPSKAKCLRHSNTAAKVSRKGQGHIKVEAKKKKTTTASMPSVSSATTLTHPDAPLTPSKLSLKSKRTRHTDAPVSAARSPTPRSSTADTSTKCTEPMQNPPSGLELTKNKTKSEPPKSRPKEAAELSRTKGKNFFPVGYKSIPTEKDPESSISKKAHVNAYSKSAYVWSSNSDFK